MTSRDDDFPSLSARTRRFTLGAPRSAHVLGTGGRALFLRSGGPEDPVTALWMSDLTVPGGLASEVLLADPARMGTGQVPAEELSRRERSRESATGITSVNTDAAGTVCAFALDGALWCLRLDVPGAAPVRLAVPGPVIDPRVSPDGRLVAWSTGGHVWVVGTDGGADAGMGADARTGADADAVGGAGAGTVGGHGDDGGADAVPVVGARTGTHGSGPAHVVGEDTPDVTWGLADFIAGEEMDRYHGLWWTADSQTLLVQRTDASTEPLWYIADPSHPDREPVPRRYPRALTSNADVRLYAVPVGGAGSGADTQAGAASGGAGGGTGSAGKRTAVPGTPVEVHWDRAAFEYLAAVSPSSAGVVILVQSRDQRNDQVLRVDTRTGDTTPVASHADPAWLDIVVGTPALTPDGRLLTAVTDADTHRLALDDTPFTPVGFQVRRVLDVGPDDVLVAGGTDPRSVDVAAVTWSGGFSLLSPGPGVHTAVRGRAGTVMTSRSMDHPGVEMVHRWGSRTRRITSLAATPPVTPHVRFLDFGEDALRSALVTPARGLTDDERLPVLVMPYGGPGAQRVQFARGLYAEAQWWADQGFVVLVADGRGTPGRGPAWERTIRGDFAGPTLEDQVRAVRALGRVCPQADLGHVAIRGWSYGGYLSALAVLARPDVFHAAVAGAPPTDWTLYDTHYTERYLGLDAQAHARSGLVHRAPRLARPLMLVHGLADDNVAFAHTMALSGALLAAGRPHCVLPLGGITHMTNDPVVARNLLEVQLDFLRRALAEKDHGSGAGEGGPGAGGAGEGGPGAGGVDAGGPGEGCPGARAEGPGQTDEGNEGIDDGR